jgi:hypothetical protein
MPTKRKEPEPYILAKVDITVTVYVDVADGLTLRTAMERVVDALKWQPLPNGPRMQAGGSTMSGTMMTQREVDRMNARIEAKEKAYAH